MKELLNEDWSDYELSIMLDFPNMDILLSFVKDEDKVDFLHNFFDSVNTYNNLKQNKGLNIK